MTILENLAGLDLRKYWTKISHYDDNHLATNIYNKRRQCTRGTFGVVTGLATVAHTAGMSLAGVAYSSRSQSVAEQKLEIMQQEWARRGHMPPEKRMIDVIPPVAIGAVALGAAHGLASGLDSLGSSAIHHAANTTQPYEYYTQWVLTPYEYVPEIAVGIEYAAAPLACVHAASTVVSHGASYGTNTAGESSMKRRDTTQSHQEFKQPPPYNAPAHYHQLDYLTSCFFLGF